MSLMSDRDVIAAHVTADCDPDLIVAALHDARTVHDATHADALPVGSVIRDAGGYVAVHNGARGIYGVVWLLAGYSHTHTRHLDFPAQLLYRATQEDL